MIKKFEEFISEGLWSKGLKRSREGEKRLEDVTPIDEICNFINRALCKKYDIPYEQIVIWKESKRVNQEKYYFLMGCKFSDLDDSYPNIQFMVDDLKTKNKNEINHVLLAINNGFIHFRDRDMTKMFGDVKPEYKSIAKIIYFIINDVIEPKIKYVIRGNFLIDIDKVDEKSLLDINKDIKY